MDTEKNLNEQEMSANEQSAGKRYERVSRPAAGYSHGYQEGGRNQRPRISRPRISTREEGAFRPDGFGGSANQNQESRQEGYRPRYNAGGYQPRAGYQPRSGYQQQEGGYQPRPKQGGYRPRYNQEGQEGGYQPRQQGGYRPQQGGFRPSGFQGRPQQGGFRKQHTAGYDPHAKYSMKKRIEYKEEHIDPNEPIRLNKYLANAGVCSRREADDFIQAGVVTVNGEVVTELGTKILRTDHVVFHETPVTLEKKVYVLLNKPKDYVTTSDDPQQRKTVMDLVKDACPEAEARLPENIHLAYDGLVI